MMNTFFVAIGVIPVFLRTHKFSGSMSYFWVLQITKADINFNKKYDAAAIVYG